MRRSAPAGHGRARAWPPTQARRAAARRTSDGPQNDERSTMTQVAEPGSARSAGRGNEGPTAGQVHHWIGGRSVEGRSGRTGPVYNPATGSLAKQVDFASTDEVDAAVAAAQAAFPAWRATSLSKRTEILFKVRNLVD